MRRRAPILASILWGLLATTASAALYVDVPDDHWAAKAVRLAAVQHDFMQPYADGSFRGDDLLTRVELALALQHLVHDLEARSRRGWDSPRQGGYAFEDLPRDPALADAARELADRYRAFEEVPGVTGTRFGPDHRVTRYEVVIALDHLLHLGEAAGAVAPRVREPRHLHFSDVGRVGGAIDDLANRYQVMEGFADGTFRGARALTRFELAALLAQTYPELAQLVDDTRVLHDHRRFQEDMPLQLALTNRLDGRADPIGSARFVGYLGPAFVQARGDWGIPIGLTDQLSDADLALGLAWTPGAAVALQPYVGGKALVTGGATMAAGAAGLLAAWSPDPFRLWLDLDGVAPLGAALREPAAPLHGSATLGLGWGLSPTLATTLELEYTDLPTAPAAGATSFGLQPALLARAGFALGF